MSKVDYQNKVLPSMVDEIRPDYIHISHSWTLLFKQLCK